MRLIEWLSGLLGPKHTVESVAAELAEGLRNGTIYLDHLGPEASGTPAEHGPRPDTVLPNGANGAPRAGESVPAPDPSASKR